MMNLLLRLMTKDSDNEGAPEDLVIDYQEINYMFKIIEA